MLHIFAKNILNFDFYSCIRFIGDDENSFNNELARIIESTSVRNLPSERANCPGPESVEWVVKVCHTVDPGRFFVHFKHLAERFKSLQQLLSEEGGTLQEPEELVVGETYAVGVENSWYRGQYTGSFNSTIGPEAEVLYEFFLIDKGSNHYASKSSIGMISKEIRDYPAMAFECSLNVETPPDKWTESATITFIAMVSDRPLVMTVYFESGPSLKVDLAQISSLNGASAIDSICEVLSTELKLQTDKSVTLKKSEIQTCNKQHSGDVTELPTSAQNAVAQPTQISEFEFTSFIQHLKKQTKVNGSMPGESDFVMAVKFLFCQSPNQIFVRPLAYEASYQKLDTDLQKEYRSTKLKFVLPEIGMKYAVYLYGHWIRGVVTNIDQHTKQYSIVCMDTGQPFRLGTPLICPLVPPFDSVPPLAVRFNLATINPKPTQSDFDIICRTNEVLLGSDEVFVFCLNRPQTIHLNIPVQVIFQQRTSTGTELVNLNEINP
jgi:Tudor domain